MDTPVLQAIIIGAGHAGLSASYYLKQAGIEHLVFEKGRIGETWRSQRWDSFRLNTANVLNVLPGTGYAGNDHDTFCSSPRFIASLEAYASAFSLPIAEKSEVTALEKFGVSEFFTVTVATNGNTKKYRSRQVIICSGGQNEKKIPAFAKNISPEIVQLHASEYRNASQLPSGPVLVVGSAQSGCQVAEDLIASGRKLFLSTSMVGRLPRKYRGKDIMDWLLLTQFFDVTPDQIPDPQMLHMKPPQLTGTTGRTISLQSLAKKGATILGRMESADTTRVFFQKNAATHVAFADGFSKKVKDMIDEFIMKNNLEAPLSDIDEEDLPDQGTACASEITSLDLEEHGVRSIIWSTGFSANFGYIRVPVLDEQGNPQHRNGISAVDGLYFLGLSWLRTRKSSLITGIKDDAAFITEKVCKYSQVPV